MIFGIHLEVAGYFITVIHPRLVVAHTLIDRSIDRIVVVDGLNLRMASFTGIQNLSSN